MKKLPIKIIAMSVLATLISACGSSAYEYRKDRMVSNIDVLLGKASIVDKTGLLVMFNSIEQDSRCAINAKCVWGGVVNVTVINGSGQLKAIKLSTIDYEKYNIVEKAFGKDIELMALLPMPVAGDEAKSKLSQKLIKLKID